MHGDVAIMVDGCMGSSVVRKDVSNRLPMSKLTKEGVSRPTSSSGPGSSVEVATRKQGVVISSIDTAIMLRTGDEMSTSETDDLPS